MAITLDDWKKLNFEKINEYSEDLTLLPDYIPHYIMVNSDINLKKREEYLKKNGIYDEINKKIEKLINLSKVLPFKTMKKLLMNECIDFIKKYPEYEDMIIFIERRK